MCVLIHCFDDARKAGSSPASSIMAMLELVLGIVYDMPGHHRHNCSHLMFDEFMENKIVDPKRESIMKKARESLYKLFEVSCLPDLSKIVTDDNDGKLCEISNIAEDLVSNYVMSKTFACVVEERKNWCKTLFQNTNCTHWPLLEKAALFALYKFVNNDDIYTAENFTRRTLDPFQYALYLSLYPTSVRDNEFSPVACKMLDKALNKFAEKLALQASEDHIQQVKISLTTNSPGDRLAMWGEAQWPKIIKMSKKAYEERGSMIKDWIPTTEYGFNKNGMFHTCQYLGLVHRTRFDMMTLAVREDPSRRACLLERFLIAYRTYLRENPEGDAFLYYERLKNYISELAAHATDTCELSDTEYMSAFVDLFEEKCMSIPEHAKMYNVCSAYKY